MIVKILRIKTGDFHLFDCDSVNVMRTVLFPRKGNPTEAETDIGMCDIDHVFPEEDILFDTEMNGAGEEGAAEEMKAHYVLLQIKSGNANKNISVDISRCEVFFLENGKTIDRI